MHGIIRVCCPYEQVMFGVKSGCVCVNKVMCGVISVIIVLSVMCGVDQGTVVVITIMCGFIRVLCV